MIDTFEIFPWQDSYTVGVSKIDEQHQKLIHLLNKLATSLANHSEPVELKNVFYELALYAVYHFQTEENIWHENFAGDIWETGHKKSHENFVTDIRALQDLENSKPFNEIIEDVLSYLTRWLIVHILESDKRMSIVVRALESGMTMEESKQHANLEISKVTGNMFETVLSMNETLTARTLQMIRESRERQQINATKFLASQDIETNLKSMGITERERDVLTLLVAGYSSKEIALRLAISFRTVEVHRAHIMQKTGTSNLIELARMNIS
jgi:hemerythrin-like metal-binding protein